MVEGVEKIFISRVKSKGNYYFYAYVYDSQNYNGLRTVHAFGRKDKALSQINLWENKVNIPSELIDLGLKIEKLGEWRRKIESA